MGQHLAGQEDRHGVHERHPTQGGSHRLLIGQARRLGKPEAVGEGRARHKDGGLRDGKQGEEQDRERTEAAEARRAGEGREMAVEALREGGE